MECQGVEGEVASVTELSRYPITVAQQALSRPVRLDLRQGIQTVKINRQSKGDQLNVIHHVLSF